MLCCGVSFPLNEGAVNATVRHSSRENLYQGSSVLQALYSRLASRSVPYPAVVKPAGSEGVCTATSCIAPLRMDPIEGWSVTGGTVSFPPAVCSALAAGRASGVIASNACPTWSPEQRFCATP